MAFKLAIAGKGGTGKTTISALLARCLIEHDLKPLLAVDADPNSCLAERLGVQIDRTIGQLREELRSQPDKIPAGIAKSEWVERLINEELTESKGFDLVVMGRQEGPDCYCYINNMLRSCLEKIEDQYRAALVDNEAGLEHLSRRSNGKIDVMLVVCHATPLGARTAMRVVDMMKSLELDVESAFLVLNRCNGDLDPGLVEAFRKTGLEIIGRVPDDTTIVDFELQEKSLLELPAESQAYQAVNQFLEELLKRRNQ